MDIVEVIDLEDLERFSEANSVRCSFHIHKGVREVTFTRESGGKPGVGAGLSLQMAMERAWAKLVNG